MIELSRFSKACKEVLEILNNVEEKELKKIPNEFLIYLEKNADKNYKTKIDINKEFDEQSLLPEAIDILAYIYRKYWCNENEKIEFDKAIQENEIEFQNEIKEKYDFKRNLEKKTQINKNEKSLIKIDEKKSILKKVFKYIKSIFKKV